MKKEYWIIVITYVAMQLSTYIAVPLITSIAKSLGYYSQETKFTIGVSWLIISFVISFLVALILLRQEAKNTIRSTQADLPTSIGWAIGGIFLSFFAQAIAVAVETLIGINPGSENTAQIIELITQAPIVILVVSILGPILEEIVFRKILFGSLYKRFNFFIAAVISSLIFAVAHMDFVHILLYAAMGFTFSFLYVKTKRILVPIFAHVAMNSIVILVQLNVDLPTTQGWGTRLISFIGGLLP